MQPSNHQRVFFFFFSSSSVVRASDQITEGRRVQIPSGAWIFSEFPIDAKTYHVISTKKKKRLFGGEKN